MSFSTAAVIISYDGNYNGPKVEPAMVITEKTDDSYSWTKTDLGTLQMIVCKG
jgi:hypothetical protein